MISYQFHNIDGIDVCLIDIKDSVKRISLKINNNDVFLVRIDASTRQLNGEDVVQYRLDRFSEQCFIR